LDKELGLEFELGLEVEVEVLLHEENINQQQVDYYRDILYYIEMYNLNTDL
jgi:hypothetical protein